MAAATLSACVQTQLAISLSDVELAYRKDGSSKCILRIPDLQIRRGQVVAILGPSGCGKTTFLQMICGIQKPGQTLRGRIQIAGQTARQAIGAGLVSLSFQTPVLMPWRTAAQNVMLPFQLKGIPDRDGALRGRASHALSKVCLADSLNEYPDALSSGMKSRVAVAQAMVCGAEILLFDEVFGTLDEPTRVHIDLELRSLNCVEMRKTILLVTHSIDEALLLGDRVVIFRRELKCESDNTILRDIPVHFRKRDRSLLGNSEFTDLRSEIHELFVMCGWTL